MRRLELSDGNSNKFWQVELIDASLKIKFGKIGSHGQIQLKKLGSPAAATAEMEKLVKEKVKKGYSEVGVTATPDPQPTPEPVPTAAPTRTSFVLTPAAKELLKKATRPVTPLPSPRTAADIIRALIKKVVPSWRLGAAKWSSEAIALFHSILAHLGADEPATQLDDEVEAAAATLLSLEEASVAFVARWLELGGPSVALSQLAKMWRYRREYELSGPTWLTIVDPAQNWDSSVCRAKQLVAIAIAAHVDAAALRPFAANLRRTLGLPARIGIATALDDAAFANEDAVDVTALPEEEYAWDAKYLLRLADDVDLLEGVGKKVGFDWLQPIFVARRIGTPAATLLAKFAGDRDGAIALATLECEESARAFVGMLDQKKILPIAKEFFLRRPDLALPALQASSARKGKAAIYAEPLLRELTPPATDDNEEATDAELPRVLAKPPWLEPISSHAAPVIEGLAYLPFEEKVHFPDAQKKKAWDEPSRSPRELSGRLNGMSAAAAKKVLDTDIGHPDYYEIRWLLVRYGVDLLDAVLGYEKLHDHVDGLAPHIESPRFAAELALAYGKSPKRHRSVLLTYFDTYPEAAAISLFPIVLSKTTQPRALPALQLFAQGARVPVLRSMAERYGVLGALDALLAIDLEVGKVPALPSWYVPAKLPPVLLKNEHALPDRAKMHLGTILAMCQPRQTSSRLESIKEACDPGSLTRFAWGLFQTWLAEGSDAKQAWAFTALGHLGGDEAARRLAPLIRAWPGESAHARAVKGLDVLAQIGSDVALMHLDGIAEKVKFKGLQENARQKIEEIAAERELTRDELADRIAPTLDLDESGSRELSFGPRTFRVGFDEHLLPFVLDDAGKRASDLPKPRAADDAAIAAQSVIAWKALKKDAKAVAQSQIRRLERAMCTERRWRAADFKALLVEHPLVVHLVRRLLWGADSQLFRVAEDRSFADADDAAVTLADDAIIGLPHRLDLGDEDLRRWGQVFGDYELLQPFAQLDREVYSITDPERTAKSLDRMNGIEVPTGKVLGLMERGWIKGNPQDAGWIWDMDKPLPGELVATLSFSGGLLAGAMAESPTTQRLGTVTVQRGRLPAPLGELSRLVFSELVRDLEGLRP